VDAIQHFHSFIERERGRGGEGTALSVNLLLRKKKQLWRQPFHRGGLFSGEREKMEAAQHGRMMSSCAFWMPKKGGEKNVIIIRMLCCPYRQIDRGRKEVGKRSSCRRQQRHPIRMIFGYLRYMGKRRRKKAQLDLIPRAAAMSSFLPRSKKKGERETRPAAMNGFRQFLCLSLKKGKEALYEGKKEGSGADYCGATY